MAKPNVAGRAGLWRPRTNPAAHAAQPHPHCGEHPSEMIRCDPFFPMLLKLGNCDGAGGRRGYPEGSLRASPRRSEGPATKATLRPNGIVWNRSDDFVGGRSTVSREEGGLSLYRPGVVLPQGAHREIFQGFRVRNFCEGGGGSKSLGDLGGRYRAGLTRRFFSWEKTFDYFSRNQRNQTALRCRPVSNANPLKDLAHLSAASSSASFRFGPNIFPGHPNALGGGRVKSLEAFRADTAWQPRVFFREIRKSFFGPWLCGRARIGGGRSLDPARTLHRSANPENRRVIQGGGGSRMTEVLAERSR
jgi:hypothetical protein